MGIERCKRKERKSEVEVGRNKNVYKPATAGGFSDTRGSWRGSARLIETRMGPWDSKEYTRQNMYCTRGLIHKSRSAVVYICKFVNTYLARVFSEYSPALIQSLGTDIYCACPAARISVTKADRNITCPRASLPSDQVFNLVLLHNHRETNPNEIKSREESSQVELQKDISGYHHIIFRILYNTGPHRPAHSKSTPRPFNPNIPNATILRLPTNSQNLIYKQWREILIFNMLNPKA